MLDTRESMSVHDNLPLHDYSENATLFQCTQTHVNEILTFSLSRESFE